MMIWTWPPPTFLQLFTKYPVFFFWRRPLLFFSISARGVPHSPLQRVQIHRTSEVQRKSVWRRGYVTGDIKWHEILFCWQNIYSIECWWGERIHLRILKNQEPDRRVSGDGDFLWRGNNHWQASLPHKKMGRRRRCWQKALGEKKTLNIVRIKF